MASSSETGHEVDTVKLTEEDIPGAKLAKNVRCEYDKV